MISVLHYTAFSSHPHGGNPAGIVLDATDLGAARMQEIAAAVGYSETAFVLPADEESRYRIRYFSPAMEVAFCGHATIATAVALAERDGAGQLTFEAPVGPIDVETVASGSGYRAALRSVPTHSRVAPPETVTAALDALGWSAQDLDPDLPPHVAFAGNHHLVLATRTRSRLRDLHYDFDVLENVMELHSWTTLQLVWREDASTFHSRNPFPTGGVVEDPATGAAAAALGGYLRAIGQVTEERTLTIVQGEDMGRRSELRVTVRPDTAQVTVAGDAVPIRPPTRWPADH